VQNNNNIVWKNIAVVDTDGSGMRFGDVVLGGSDRERQEVRLVFHTPKDASLFDWDMFWLDFAVMLLTPGAKAKLRAKALSAFLMGGSSSNTPGQS